MILDASQMRKVEEAISSGRSVPPDVLRAYKATVEAIARQKAEAKALPSEASPVKYDPNNPYGMASPGAATAGFMVDAAGGGIPGPVVRHLVAQKTVAAGDPADTVFNQTASFGAPDLLELGSSGRRLRAISLILSASGALPTGFTEWGQLMERLAAGKLIFEVGSNAQGHIPFSALRDTGFESRYALVFAKLDPGNFASLVLRLLSASTCPRPAAGQYVIDAVLECSFDPHPGFTQRMAA